MRSLRAGLAFLCAVFAPVVLAAQQTTDFVPVDPATEAAETLPAAPMVMGAYALVWLVLVAYVWSLRRRQARVELEMAALRARMNSHAATPPAGAPPAPRP